MRLSVEQFVSSEHPGIYEYLIGKFFIPPALCYLGDFLKLLYSYLVDIALGENRSNKLGPSLLMGLGLPRASQVRRLAWRC